MTPELWQAIQSAEACRIAASVDNLSAEGELAKGDLRRAIVFLTMANHDWKMYARYVLDALALPAGVGDSEVFEAFWRELGRRL